MPGICGYSNVVLFNNPYGTYARTGARTCEAAEEVVRQEAGRVVNGRCMCDRHCEVMAVELQAATGYVVRRGGRTVSREENGVARRTTTLNRGSCFGHKIHRGRNLHRRRTCVR